MRGSVGPGEITSISHIPLLTLTFALLVSTEGIPDASAVSTPSCPWIGAVWGSRLCFRSLPGHKSMAGRSLAVRGGVGTQDPVPFSDTVPYHGAFKAAIVGSQIFFINTGGHELIKINTSETTRCPGTALRRISCGTAGPFEMLATTERLVFPSRANGNTHRRTKTNAVWGPEHFGQPV